MFPHLIVVPSHLWSHTRSDGQLRVHYSDRLVSLLREVRQLAVYGFVIPAKILLIVKSAKKYAKYALNSALKTLNV